MCPSVATGTSARASFPRLSCPSSSSLKYFKPSPVRAAICAWFRAGGSPRETSERRCKAIWDAASATQTPPPAQRLSWGQNTCRVRFHENLGAGRGQRGGARTSVPSVLVMPPCSFFPPLFCHRRSLQGGRAFGRRWATLLRFCCVTSRRGALWSADFPAERPTARLPPFRHGADCPVPTWNVDGKWTRGNFHEPDVASSTQSPQRASARKRGVRAQFSVQGRRGVSRCCWDWYKHTPRPEGRIFQSHLPTWGTQKGPRRFIKTSRTRGHAAAVSPETAAPAL